MPTGEDQEEYTLCAFGDISLSNIYFVPGPLEALSPKSVTIRSGPIAKVNRLLCHRVSSEIKIEACGDQKDSPFSV